MRTVVATFLIMTRGYTKLQKCSSGEIGIQLMLSLTGHPLIVHNAAAGLTPFLFDSSIPCLDVGPSLII